MRFADLLLGRPIANQDRDEVCVGSVAAVPVLGLDALASAAYGPEALLTVLLPLGLVGLPYMAAIIPLLVLVLVLLFVSYRQTIRAYPDGGGAYTVAKENLGARPSLLAAAALALDYILNVAVAIAAGVGAFVSVVPSALPYTLPLCLAILAVLVLVNLRGFRTTGFAFMIPTYAFVSMMAIVIGVGVVKIVMHGWHPDPVTAPPRAPAAAAAVTLPLLVRAFANGCTALTGVEAISNGIPIFREPRVRNAQRALATIVVILTLLLFGEALLCNAFEVVATEPGKTGYQSVLSSLTGAIVGRGIVYDVAIASVIAVLMLSANTSFADFPRLCRLLARDHYLPEPFSHRGRRLAFSNGVWMLSAIAALLLIVFGGITDALIPLFAIGALGAFTMSQLGMVGHWRRVRGKHSRRSLVLNAVGACATAITLAIVLVAKLVEGAWITVVLVAAIYILLRRVRRHFDWVSHATDAAALEVGTLYPPIALVPLRRWDALAVKAMQLALGLAKDVVAVQVRTQDRELEELSARWPELVGNAARLEVIDSELRKVEQPLVELVHRLAETHPRSEIIVIIPELVERRWYHSILHGRAASSLRRALLRHGGPQVVIASAPWHLADSRRERRHVRGGKL